MFEFDPLTRSKQTKEVPTPETEDWFGRRASERASERAATVDRGTIIEVNVLPRTSRRAHHESTSDGGGEAEWPHPTVAAVTITVNPHGATWRTQRGQPTVQSAQRAREDGRAGRGTTALNAQLRKYSDVAG